MYYYNYRNVACVMMRIIATLEFVLAVMLVCAAAIFMLHGKMLFY